MALYWIIRFASVLARIVPLRVSYPLARAGGTIAYYLWRGGRRRSIGNMLHVVDGDARLARRHARRSFGNYAVYLVAFVRLVHVTPTEVASRVDFDEWGLIERHRDGNGILFVTVHFGNWDLGAAALTTHGFPVTTIADSFSDPRLNELVIGSREHLGLKVISAQRIGSGILRALRAMGHGDDLIVADANFPSDSVARQTVIGKLLRLDAGAPEAVAAVLSVMPLDTFVDDAAARMEIVGAPDEIAPVQAEVQAAIDAERTEIERRNMLLGGEWFESYHNYFQIKRHLLELARRFPELAEAFWLDGETHEGRRIRGIRLTGPGSLAVRPAVFFNGCQHAREWISPATVVYIVEQLLEGYAGDPEIRRLLDGVEFHVVPVVTPDG